MSSRVLIVDDEQNIRTSFSSLLMDEGMQTRSAVSAEEAARLCAVQPFDLILLDLHLPGQHGLDFLKKLKEDPFSPAVLVISGQADIPDALKAVRLGAIDYLEKPVPPEKLISSVRAALALAAAEKQRTLMVDELDEQCRIVGQSEAVRKLNNTIAQVAPTDTTVLITGENGTGKELVATRIYLASRRRQAPFLKVNCPGIPETLFESELFGHVKGAFTGAVKDHPGKFALADGGTIFLDEIGDLPLACQAKLLRVLETGEIETLGASQARQVDVRVVCATNRKLNALISEGRFRQDLFYRISVFNVDVPPLATRPDDIPLLPGEFLKRFDPSGHTRFTPVAMAYLCTREYPGNVRQLKNLIERLTILCAGRTIDVDDVTGHFGGSAPTDDSLSDDAPLASQLIRFEKALISQTLSQCEGNIAETARRLGMDRANLSRKVKEWGLKTQDY
ncbi:MAG: sigma-54 dependent transcriptional regulator [candidate division Zixibacteria bacterium]|nr:sigma-54 dependent transcriptional regulator [candidate division Zixibacteria bacterium]